MGLFVLLAALFETIGDTIKESAENRRALEEQRRYEDIDWDNIAFVTFDGAVPAYRIEEEEEFDIVASVFLTQQDGWQHYETKTLEYEVPDGEDYCFTIRYKNGTEIYRKFHESSEIAQKLLGFKNKVPGTVEITYADGTKKVFKFDDMPQSDLEDEFEEEPHAPKFQPKPKKERFAVIDFETTGLNYNFRRPPMDEILSVAIIDQDGNTLLDTLCDTVHIKSWYEAQCIHGISPRMVKGYPTFPEIMPKVIEILSSYDYVIAYNVPFEKSFLENYVRLYTPTDFSVCKVRWGEDPMAMFMDHMNSRKFLKLETAARNFGYKYHAHNALEDAKATLFVYNTLRRKGS